MSATEWTSEKPTTPGLYWVWKPEDEYPCYGRMRAVEVEGCSEGRLMAEVPTLGYSEDLSATDWDNSMWMGPITRPEPPMGLDRVTAERGAL